MSTSLIQSNFDYACNYWFKVWLNYVKHRLQTVQNKIIRYVLNLFCKDHIGIDEFLQMNWLNVTERCNYLTLNIMYNIFNGSAPSYMCHLNFVCNAQSSVLGFSVPHVKSQDSRTFKYNGIILWNILPHNVKSAQPKYLFKKLCKDFLIWKKMRKAEDSDFAM